MIMDDERVDTYTERFRLAMEATSDGIWDWNLLTGTVYYSPAYYHMLGYDSNEFADRPAAWMDLIHPEDRERTIAINKECIEGRRQSFHVEFRMLAKDGEWRWILGRGCSITRGTDGRSTRMVGTHVDITERRLTEERIRRLLAEKDLILREVHHRIKNNLNTVRSMLRLQSASLEDEVAGSALTMAAERIHAIAALYDRLYLLGHYDSVSSSELLPELIREIVDGYPQASHVALTVRIEEICITQRNIMNLAIIINELISNAMKYAFPDQRQGHLAVTLKRSEESLLVTVEDNGPGMGPHREGEREGFGLLLVRSLAEQMQGTVEFAKTSGTSKTY